MPGNPNQKVPIGLTANRETTAMTNANVKAMLLTQDGLEHIQKLIEANTTPPVIVSLAAISTWVSALP